VATVAPTYRCADGHAQRQLLQQQVDQRPMDQADAILAQYPGPVRLHVSRLKRRLMVAIGAPVAAICAWILFAGHARLSEPGGTAVLVVIVMVWAGGSAIAGAYMLRRPAVGYVTLDADGFETSGLYGEVARTHWRDVSEFRLRPFPKSGGGSLDPVAVYDLPNAPLSAPGWGMLPDNYGLTEPEVVKLMNAWRDRALRHPPIRDGSPAGRIVGPT
jgi:hypothetical protein